MWEPVRSLRFFRGFSACSLMLAVGCSSSDEGDSGADGTKPTTPEWVSIEPMAGGLHLVWTKHTDCDSVAVDRKTDADPYETIASVDCEADNKHDADATEDMDYTYRLRAKKGEVYSGYSEEKTAHP